MSESLIANPDSGLEVVASRDRPSRLFPPRRPLSQPMIVSTDATQLEYDKRPTQTIHMVQAPGATHVTHRNPFGWSPLIFGLVVGLTTAVIVGAAVGGGVGGALSHHRISSTAPMTTDTVNSMATASSTGSSSVSASSAPTSLLTSYVPATPETIQTLEDGCNELDNTERTTVRGQTYRYSCFNLYTAGDLASIFVYSLEACVEACSSMNFFASKYSQPQGSKTCTRIAYNTLLGGTLGDQYANCWLKGGNATLLTSTGDGHSVAAELIAG